MVTLDDPPKLMSAFHRSNRRSFRERGMQLSYQHFSEESNLERVLIHLLELKPVGINSVLSLTEEFRRLKENPEDRDLQDTFMGALSVAMDNVIEPDIAPIQRFPFSFAPPEYAFLSSRKLRTFFPNINEVLDFEHLTAQFVKAIDQIRTNNGCTRLGFIEKAFGPLGAIELRAALCNKTQLPSTVYRAYSWKRDLQPISAGRLERGDKVCIVYDAGITGGLIREFAEYAKSLGASTTGAVVFFDFAEGAEESLAELSILYRPLLKKQDVLEEIACRYEDLYQSEFMEYPDPAKYPSANQSFEPSTLERQFESLTKQWIQDTSYHTSPTLITRHPAYQGLLKLGKPILPLVIRNLEIRPGNWFHLLADLADANPVPHVHRGNIFMMRHYWLNWARKNGYLDHATGSQGDTL